MAHIVSSIEFVQNFKKHIHNGDSVLKSMDKLCCSKKTDSFNQSIHCWWLYYKHGKGHRALMQTDYEKTLVQIIKKGAEGAPIYEHLELLESEMLKEFDRKWRAYLETMPFKLMIPLLFFFFPSYIILLFGPLFMQFLTEVPL